MIQYSFILRFTYLRDSPSSHFGRRTKYFHLVQDDRTIPEPNVYDSLRKCEQKRFRKKLWRKNIICRILNIESRTFIRWNGEAGHYINALNITYEYIGLQLHFYLPRYITIYLLEVNINDRVLMFPYFIGLISVFLYFVIKVAFLSDSTPILH